ncbi:MAG TPA: 16S rRNA (adenine(1518)-N(6)/adenine(1519)-N(6))-dimethyltransferase RsmA [Actinomycetota bacterium]|nr:16S rRNA (adenine(1518)-N(6)/adenine(1519)-N(6))-dimethyltransferase RsmA [Actinomycetota bacterium]
MTKGLLGARRVREILERNGVRPQKSLGQNFVIDPNTIRKVIAAAGVGPQTDVLEIGAGAGSLTVGLAAECRSVIAVEFDRRLIPVLEEVTKGYPNVNLVEADVLELDLSDIAADNLVANLPYNIATPVVMRVLESAPQISALTVMTQREVGERMVAKPGSKIYGAPTVLAAYFCSARIAGRVSRRAFWPIPGVDSVIVRFSRKPRQPEVPYQLVQKVVRNAFSQRRKTLRNTLAGTFGAQTPTETVLAEAGIEASARAEEIGLDGFVSLARALLQD